MWDGQTYIKLNAFNIKQQGHKNLPFEAASFEEKSHILFFTRTNSGLEMCTPYSIPLNYTKNPCLDLKKPIQIRILLKPNTLPSSNTVHEIII
jgi:hypothetical protein